MSGWPEFNQRQQLATEAAAAGPALQQPAPRKVRQGSKKPRRHVVEEAEQVSDAYSSDEDWLAEQPNPASKTRLQVQRVVYKVGKQEDIKALVYSP